MGTAILADDRQGKDGATTPLVGLWVYDSARRVLSVDERCRALFALDGAGDLPMERILAAIHPDDREGVSTSLVEAIQNKGDLHGTFRIPRDGERDGWVQAIGWHDDAGGTTALSGVILDTTAERELEAQRRLHLAEMNHRIKNLFALVSAMIGSADREAQSREDLVENLRGRVAALDRAHSMISGGEALEPLPLDDLIERILAPALGPKTVTMNVEPVLIPISILTPLVLILHEWVTNSAKHGALAAPDRTLTIDARRDGDGLRILWREQAPDYDAKALPGFGSRLLQASVLQLGAEKTRNFEDGWLTIDLRLPLDDAE